MKTRNIPVHVQFQMPKHETKVTFKRCKANGYKLRKELLRACNA